MASVTLQGLSKVYDGSAKPSLDHLDLEISDGEFLVLVGPSGCGKSTALKLIGGLEDPSGGDVFIGEQRVTDFESRDRDIAMVFQSYALYPHMSVFDNIAFPLQIAKVDKAEISKRVQSVAETLHLTAFLNQRPGRLSGGQRQRVAMGRAIIRQPSVFLMDEPLSNLDAKLRVKMRSEIAQIQRRLDVTTIYVTHDQVEAMTMGDRVAIMREGVLQQVATPDDLYRKPANTFVASFIGSPPMNLFRASLSGTGDKQVTLGDQTLTIAPESIEAYPGISAHTGEVVLGIRPEDIEDADLSPDTRAGDTITAEIAHLESLGADHMVHLALEAEQVHVGDQPQDQVETPLGPTSGGLCICRFSPRSKARSGDRVRARIATDNLHFFDPATGGALNQ
ncbi:ABC transporter ATP-binding protein [Ruegeria sp. HKCCD7255]|uniref:ABC transporter ATP-binding protein n=1 Tax=Ruegeria sp. HKCCD7255 TaxID=2683004 RepID=UPI00148A0065|nr:sn-glycerol-3-phosphate ABC transporter ATP-binding protein UgpC [Ruegeria sp. HKCCD7255]